MKSKKKLRKFLKSLRFRLVTAFIFFGMLPGIALRIGIIRGYEKRAVSNRSIDISSQAKILANQVVTYNYMAAECSGEISWTA